MINVLKASGAKEPFSEDKVRYSIYRAGISDELQHEVLNHVKQNLYDNIPTSEIYHHIVEYLDKTDNQFAKAKYSLKQSIMDLGPTGYPFEDYLAEIFKMKGYLTKVRQILNGKCITHEIDVIASKENKKIMIEAKFHNNPGTRTDAQVALYTKARFDDVKEEGGFNECMLITNTKATIDVLNYGKCAGVKVISWSTPEGEGLRDLVEKYHLHPITALTTLSASHKQKLLENHIVLCRYICEDNRKLDLLGLPRDKVKDVISEVQYVCDFKG